MGAKSRSKINDVKFDIYEYMLYIMAIPTILRYILFDYLMLQYFLDHLMQI